jgi:biopolymer transport protein ExbB/TolQ
LRKVNFRSSQIKLVSDYPDQVFFASTFIIGSLFITFMKNWNVASQWLSLTSMITSMGLIIVYAVVSRTVHTFRLSSERVGDNCYYLGFLFTLVSLSNALYSFGYGDDDTINYVISNFGIALGSTIVGMLMRVMFNQMKIEPEQIEERIKENLTDTGHRLTGEIENVIGEMNSLSSTLKNSMAEALESTDTLLKDSKKRHASLVDSIDKLTEDVIARNEKSATAINESIERITGTSSLEAPTQTIRKSLEKFAENINDANSKMEKLSSILDVAVKSNKTSSSRLLLSLLTSRFKD